MLSTIRSRAPALAGALILSLALGSAAPAQADGSIGRLLRASAITQVLGEGQKLVAVAVEFDKDLDAGKLSPSDFSVEGRNVTRAYANAAPALADKGVNGKFAVLELSPDDPDAALYLAGMGPGAAPTIKPAKASVAQIAPIAAADGGVIAAGGKAVTSGKVANLVVDAFKQLKFKDAKTGDTLKYNLFAPTDYDGSKSYPLVLFMHDAGVTSADPMMTLVQGLGAISFAGPADQAKHPAFVLAPQYSAQIVDDNSQATSALDTTIDLVNALAQRYNIDKSRLYATGQSGGAMMTIAMDIKYPDIFAASFIVAGQWDPALVAPLAKEKLWIVVSQGDEKAYPGENAITAALEKAGARVSRAVWDGRATPEQFDAGVKAMEATGTPINYVALKKGTVVPVGQTDDAGANHVNTWRVAFAIDGIRDWLFEQRK